MAPFVQIFHGQVDGQHAKTYVCGLLGNGVAVWAKSITAK
jgi:hypothetical protein